MEMLLVSRDRGAHAEIADVRRGVRSHPGIRRDVILAAIERQNSRSLREATIRPRSGASAKSLLSAKARSCGVRVITICGMSISLDALCGTIRSTSTSRGTMWSTATSV